MNHFATQLEEIYQLFNEHKEIVESIHKYKPIYYFIGAFILLAFIIDTLSAMYFTENNIEFIIASIILAIALYLSYKLVKKFVVKTVEYRRNKTLIKTLLRPYGFRLKYFKEKSILKFLEYAQSNKATGFWSAVILYERDEWIKSLIYSLLIILVIIGLTQKTKKTTVIYFSDGRRIEYDE